MKAHGNQLRINFAGDHLADDPKMGEAQGGRAVALSADSAILTGSRDSDVTNQGLQDS